MASLFLILTKIFSENNYFLHFTKKFSKKIAKDFLLCKAASI